MDQYIIEFSRPTDPRTGFLSNASSHGFELEGKWWPTVEHYVCAKMFEGTQYEEEIRLAPSVSRARLLAREKHVLCDDEGRVSRQRVYGKESAYRQRVDWKDARPRVMEDGVRAKFGQNRRLMARLVDTGNARLVDVSDRLTGSILEKVRGDRPKPPSVALKALEDIPGAGTLSAGEKKIVQSIITLSRRVAELEGQAKIYAEMVEDAIYTLTHAVDEDVVESISAFYEGTKWSDIFCEMPRFKKIVDAVHDMFSVEEPDQKRTMGGSALIAGFIRWLRNVDRDSRLKVWERSKTASSLPVHFLKKERWYRSVPTRVKAKTKLKRRPRRKMAQRSEEAKKEAAPPKKVKVLKSMPNLGIELAQEGRNTLIVRGEGLTRHCATLLAMGGNHPIKGFTVDNTDMIEFTGSAFDRYKARLLQLGGKMSTKRENVLIVRGHLLQQNRDALLNMGGKYVTKTLHVTDTSSVVFPLSRMREVVEELLETLPSTEREQQWHSLMIETLIDTAAMVASFSKRSMITEDDVVRTVREIYGYADDDSDNGADNRASDEEVARFLDGVNAVVAASKVKIRKKAVTLLAKYIAVLREERKEKAAPIGGLTSEESCIALAMQNIATSLPDEGREAEKRMHAFFIIAPTYLRQSARQFMTSVSGLPSDASKDEAQSHLKKRGVTFDLKRLEGLEESPSSCVVFAAALHFFSPKIRKDAYERVLQRALSMMPSVPPTIDTPPPQSYTEADLDTEMKRGVVYLQVLQSLRLPNETYSKMVAKLEKTSPDNRLKVVNEMATASNGEKRVILSNV